MRGWQEMRSGPNVFSNLWCTFLRRGAANGWLECIILGCQPFSFCEKKILHSHFKHDTLPRKTVMSYMQKLLLSVERKVFETLPSELKILFNGWTGAILTTLLCSRCSLPKYRHDMGNFYSDCLLWKTKIPSMQSIITNSFNTIWKTMKNNLLLSFPSLRTTQAPTNHSQDVFGLIL